MLQLPELSGLKVKYQDIRRFFEFLAVTDEKEPFLKEPFAVSFLYRDSCVPQHGTFIGTYAEIKAKVKRFYAAFPGFSLHVTLNRTDLNGRKLSNIEAPRVLCVDLDTPRKKEVILEIVKNYSPDLIVESSAGKFHVYWKIDSGFDLPLWQRVQLSLAYRFKGDLTLDVITHTIRVPGVPRIGKDGMPSVPTIVYASGITSLLTVADLEKRFPAWQGDYTKALAQREANRKAIREELTIWRDTGKVKSKKGMKTTQSRNCTLYMYLKDIVQKSNDYITYEALQKEALKVNKDYIARNNKGPLSIQEVENVTLSAFNRGHARREALSEKNKAAKETLKEVFSEVLEAPHETKDRFNGYDFKATGFKAGRFTDRALAERVLQRFNGSMMRLGGSVYAFDWHERTWMNQNKVQDIVGDFVNKAIYDVFKDPKFVKEKCTTKEGAHSDLKEKQAKEKFTSNAVYNATISRVLGDNRIRKLKDYEFDSKAGLLFCANGVLDLSTLQLRAPQPEDYLLHNNGINYDPNARCPRWEEFLSEVFAQNDSPLGMVKFIQQVFGYSITGSVGLQKIFIHYGSGSNGKSKVLDMLAAISGGYGSRLVSGKVFGKRQDKEVERIAVKLEGKRVGIVDDLDSKMKWDEGIVKALTSKSLPRRKLYEEEGDIPNRAKFHMGCNEAPEPETENYGILRRLCIIPYPRRFQPTLAKEEELQTMIREEPAGVLNWAIKGLQGLLEREGKLDEPDEIQISVEEYKETHFVAEKHFHNTFAPSDGVEGEWFTMEEIMEKVNQNLPVSKILSFDQTKSLLNSIDAKKRRMKNEVTGLKETKYRLRKRSQVKSVLTKIGEGDG